MSTRDAPPELIAEAHARVLATGKTPRYFGWPMLVRHALEDLVAERRGTWGRDRQVPERDA